MTGRLRDKSRKITGPRAAILEILRQHPHPFTNKEILAGLPKGQCDLATVYRSMHLLEKMGMVQRLQKVRRCEKRDQRHRMSQRRHVL